MLQAYRRFTQSGITGHLHGQRAQWDSGEYVAECWPRGTVAYDAADVERARARSRSHIAAGTHPSGTRQKSGGSKRECWCGIHGAWDWDDRGTVYADGYIIAITTHWGTVDIGTRGLRSTHAEIDSLHVVSGVLAPRKLFVLAMRYQVRVYVWPTYDAMRRGLGTMRHDTATLDAKADTWEWVPVKVGAPITTATTGHVGCDCEWCVM